jgi:hypothetical protein
MRSRLDERNSTRSSPRRYIGGSCMNNKASRVSPLIVPQAKRIRLTRICIFSFRDAGRRSQSDLGVSGQSDARRSRAFRRACRSAQRGSCSLERHGRSCRGESEPDDNGSYSPKARRKSVTRILRKRSVLVVLLLCDSTQRNMSPYLRQHEGHPKNKDGKNYLSEVVPTLKIWRIMYAELHR